MYWPTSVDPSLPGGPGGPGGPGWAGLNEPPGMTTQILKQMSSTCGKDQLQIAILQLLHFSKNNLK